MNENTQKLHAIRLTASVSHPEALNQIRTTLEKELGYRFSEVDEARPWGAFYQITSEQADRFLAEFFPGLDPMQARLGHVGLALSPKILVVYPEQRLSWQYHTYRAERWRFLTAGSYYKSTTDEQGTPYSAKPGDEVQFETGERHRLVGATDGYTLVAEIWQHTDPLHPSSESDIVRLADDYKR